MNIFSDHLVRRQEIIDEIHAFVKDPEEMVALAREYNLAIPRWSVWGSFEKITGLFSSIWLDRALTRSPLLDNPKNFPYNNPTHCYCLADALVAKNFFNQRYIKRLHTFDQLVEALQDREPGIFRITCPSLFFGERMEYFPSHAMSIIKFSENNSIKYQVVQIFHGKYKLSDFIKNYEHEFNYENFADLEKYFLNPLKKIFYFTEQWGKEEKEAYEKVTKVDIKQMKGNPISEKMLKLVQTGISQPRWTVERTTNSGYPTCASLFHGISTAIVVAFIASKVLFSEGMQ